MDKLSKLGIIAGKGAFPILLAEKVKFLSPQTEIYSVGFIGETNKKIRKYALDFKLIQLGQLGTIIEYFKTQKVDKVVMGGLIKHERIFDKNVKLDDIAKQMFDKMKDKKADSILATFADELKKEGIELLPLLDLLGDSVADKGVMTETQPNETHLSDMDFGFKIAKEISKLDIGQTIVVKNKCVLAVESIEGTDICIFRAGKLAGKDTVIIKVAKLHQDFRFDIPIIGPRTMKIMHKIRSRVIGVESKKTCIVDKEEVIRLANKYEISIVGI